MEGSVWKTIKLLVLVIHLFGQNASLSMHAKPPQKIISFSVPEKRPLQKSLGFIEDTYLNFTELTTKYNYPTETHQVITQDGYILTVFRILQNCPYTKPYPIVMMHGIYDSADEWILTGPQTGIGYILTNNCYDVWLANHRGNVYSRKHLRLNPDTDPEFWNYTFDEHGYYDLPAIIDYVLTATNKPKLNYIGHSQGTTDFFVMASLRPEYNDKIQLSIQLAPVAWMKHIQSPLPLLVAPRSREIKAFLDETGFRELFAKHQISHSLLEFICQYSPDEICGTGLFFATGYVRGNIAPKTLAVAFGHLLAGISSKDLEHLGQLIATGRFQRYDEGRKGNIKRYGSPRPPEYDVSKITSPVALICAQNDWVSSLKDTEKLRSKLPNVFEYYVVPDPSWSHNDHVYGVKAPKLVFAKILKLLNRVNS